MLSQKYVPVLDVTPARAQVIIIKRIDKLKLDGTFII